MLLAGECEVTNAELRDSQKAGAELMQDREELSAQVATLEQQLEGLTQEHDTLKYDPCDTLFAMWDLT